MRIIPVLAALFLGVSPAVVAREATPLGFLRMVNAVAQGTGKLTLEIDGANVYKKGYDLGQATSGIGVPTGIRRVTVRREGVKEGTTRVKLGKDQTVTLIPFAERVPATDDEPAHWQMRIMRLRQRDVDKNRTATFVSVSRRLRVMVEMIQGRGKWDAVSVKRLGTAELSINARQGFVSLRSGDVKLPPIGVDGIGNYVVVLYDDAKGGLNAFSFFDAKFLTAD